MSGYLQRLVQTAAHPAQTVHPFAGSVFAAPHDEKSQSRGFESEEFVIAAPQQQNAPQYSPSRNTARPAEYRPSVPASAATRILLAGEVDAVPSWPEEIAPRPHPAANVAVTEISPPHDPEGARREFRALLPQEAVTPESLPTYAPLRSEIRDRPQNGRSVTLERASDEIQIHIGRIEVTAVQPPAPRAPKSPDRTPRLDAYLKRSAR
jgi:hypothetical protein